MNDLARFDRAVIVLLIVLLVVIVAFELAYQHELRRGGPRPRQRRIAGTPPRERVLDPETHADLDTPHVDCVGCERPLATYFDDAEHRTGACGCDVARALCWRHWHGNECVQRSVYDREGDERR